MEVHEDLTTLYIRHPLSSVHQNRKKSYTRSRGSRKAGLAGESKQKFRQAKVFLCTLDFRKGEINQKREEII